MTHPVKVTEDYMEKFVRKLKLDLPANIKVHNMAVNVLSGRWPYSEFWVDCWPDFNGAIVVPNKEALPTFQRVYLLCGTEMSVKFLLKHCVEWSPPLEFHGIYEDLYPALVEAAHSHGLIQSACYDNHVFGMRDNRMNRYALMEGYTTKPLGQQQLPYIVKHWPHSHLFENPYEYLGTVLSCFPTLGVFDCHGGLAAHAGLYPYGSVGFLGVDEEHQRKGLGKFLLSEMFGIASQSGIIPHTNIIYGNTASLNLHRAAGILQLTEKCEKLVIYKNKSIHA